MTEKKERQTQKKPEVLVYCGPSVRGVAKQFTVYHKKLPAELVKFLAKHPAAQTRGGPREDFAGARVGLNTKGSVQDTLYKTILKDL